ncbi:hypothetical protein ACHQM5_005909 [Ranunculus cassubicifolius]
MGLLDSIPNGSVPAFSKDFGKKKRVNRLAKLKQCKLDARREQWLSKAKSKGNKEESKGGDGFPPASLPNERSRRMEISEKESRGEETEGSSIHDSDLESLENSLRSTDSRKDRPGSSCGSTSGISSISCSSGNFSEEEEEGEDDGCLDDWEAVADALSADDKQHHQSSETVSDKGEHLEQDVPDACPELPKKVCVVDSLVSECRNMIPRSATNNRAWRADDAFRPQSLPNLSKQSHLVCGSKAWTRNMTVSPPSSCPICYEDLDLTDSSFMPCVCGFRLCLFCYKRIFEVGDGRCPGCRRTYDPIDGNAVINAGTQPVVQGAQAVYRLTRSCSMSTKFWGKVSH